MSRTAILGLIRPHISCITRSASTINGVVQDALIIVLISVCSEFTTSDSPSVTFERAEETFFNEKRKKGLYVQRP